MIASYSDLQYFIELAQTLNFSRASERIGISQPSLSVAIKRLEFSIGAELFIRSKHKVLLTPAGKNLLTHSKQLLQLWNKTKANCLASQDEVQGDIIFGCHHSVALTILPKILPALLKTYPKLGLQLKHDLSRKIAEEIIDYTIDIGIVVNPIKHPDLIIKKMYDDEVSCWQSPSFDANATQDNIIICDPNLTQTQWILKKLKNKNIKYTRMITTSNLEVAASLAAQGTGIAILPSKVAESYQSALKPSPHAPIYHDEICFAYRHENRNIKAIQVIIGAIKGLMV